jgi:transportin-3
MIDPQISDTLEQLEILLEVVDTFGEDQPLSCRNAHVEAWGLFDPLLKKYGNSMDVTERITRVLRFGIQFFGNTIASLVPSVLETLSYSFDQTGYSSCMWIAGKLVQRFGTTEEQAITTSIRSMYDRMSQKTAELLQTTDPRTLPDGAFSSIYYYLSDGTTSCW